MQLTFVRSYSVAGALLLSSLACFAQNVRVLVINGQNGQRLSEQAISVQFITEKPDQVSAPLRLETNSEGEASFAIPEKVPSKLDVRLTPNSANWHCACYVMAEAATVIHEGIVENAYEPSKPPTQSPQPEAGTVTFVLRPLAWWERMIGPIVRQ
jgi:hypothetical protein